jgi:type IV pilus assembly protein PilM
MVRLLARQRGGPIGVDLGSRSVKLVQFDAARERLLEAVRWDLPQRGAAALAEAEGDEPGVSETAQLLRAAREGRDFRGRDAVLCLGGANLHVQNLRVPKGSPEELQRMVYREAAGRIPFPVEQAELRFIEAGEVRQAGGVRREIIVLAVHQAVLEHQLQTLVESGLRPVAVDVEPLALLRCYLKQYRRDEDRDRRAMFVHIGASQTLAVIARGVEVLFIKYIDVGGRHLDDAVAKTLKMELADASALRRHNGDRRADQQDPEVSRGISEATRPIIDQLAGELSMCARYHSVTFRGEPLETFVLGGGEASPGLLEALSASLDLRGELGDPLRTFEASPSGGRRGQWDVAAGLALRQTE